MIYTVWLKAYIEKWRLVGIIYEYSIKLLARGELFSQISNFWKVYKL